MSLNRFHGMLPQQKRCGGGLEQSFYRGTPAMFQTLGEGFFRGRSVSVRCRVACTAMLERCPLADAREGRPPCRRRSCDAIRQSPGHACEMTMRERRVMDTIDTSGFMRRAACGLRRVDAQLDVHALVRASSPSTNLCASRRMRLSCVCEVSTRMSQSHRVRACACSSREISRALSHPRIAFFFARDRSHPCRCTRWRRCRASHPEHSHGSSHRACVLP